ncbi:hypothetical protein KIN20_027242 [Parelaphostrongylus tenuis]|uniref:Uncharacterized protein n=1 Tax=Parelaphostrongylus tenuis TaxID=148309 RepID=A0AAD5QZ57_PARTN|nr:hypothetical protein KIN20_027242 [Parelaphostrongylus tenuis]
MTRYSALRFIVGFLTNLHRLKNFARRNSTFLCEHSVPYSKVFPIICVATVPRNGRYFSEQLRAIVDDTMPRDIAARRRSAPPTYAERRSVSSRAGVLSGRVSPCHTPPLFAFGSPLLS